MPNEPFCQDLWIPNGVAFYGGSVYVATIDRILRYDNAEQNKFPRAPSAQIAILPNHTWYVLARLASMLTLAALLLLRHGWRYLRVHKDQIYVAIGAPCNVPGDEWEQCLSDPIWGTIQIMNLDGSNQRAYARGIRNTLGFTWHPQTDEMWFTDNGRDNMKPDHINHPPEEVNHAPVEGMHFGYPFCYGYNLNDPEFFNGTCNVRECSSLGSLYLSPCCVRGRFAGAAKVDDGVDGA